MSKSADLLLALGLSGAVALQGCTTSPDESSPGVDAGAGGTTVASGGRAATQAGGAGGRTEPAPGGAGSGGASATGGASSAGGSGSIPTSSGGAVQQGDGGGPPAGTVGVVVAVGRGGRTMISCDDGRTWMENRIETAAAARCWGQPDNAIPEFLDAEETIPNPDWIECDHHTGSTTGLVYQGGWFFKSMGWGTEGRTLRSQDGVTWDAAEPAFDATYLGLVTVGGVLFAMGVPVGHVSRDLGLTWEETSDIGWDVGHIRHATASTYGGGTVLMLLDQAALATRDGGATFEPMDIPCGNALGLTSGGDVSVLTSGDGSVCTTADGGRSWTEHAAAQRAWTRAVWDGTAFHLWGDGDSGTPSRFTSPDGASWTATPLTSPVSIETVGVTATGAFVATNGIWNGGYENQRFYRSDDGITWDALPATAFTPSHPISRFAAGRVPANAYCSAR